MCVAKTRSICFALGLSCLIYMVRKVTVKRYKFIFFRFVHVLCAIQWIRVAKPKTKKKRFVNILCFMDRSLWKLLIQIYGKITTSFAEFSNFGILKFYLWQGNILPLPSFKYPISLTQLISAELNILCRIYSNFENVHDKLFTKY